MSLISPTTSVILSASIHVSSDLVLLSTTPPFMSGLFIKVLPDHKVNTITQRHFIMEDLSLAAESILSLTYKGGGGAIGTQS
ncbi:hypothetical protein GDO78_003992 [Eleutherodactylus coqui]|uniref:Uncharacterized protein n=1 Tax=Eleutherodactylus coqui TaxID=57060 RepID=A0A8J6EVY9_ELECQ|nr:hypothetical protein GDO78_003992 [Eleutherodactylus coqui]